MKKFFSILLMAFFLLPNIQAQPSELKQFKLENGLGASSLNNQKTLGTHPAMSRA